MEQAFHVPEGVGDEQARFDYIRAHFPPPPCHQAPPPPVQASHPGKSENVSAEVGGRAKGSERAKKRLTISQHAAVLVWLDDEQSQLMWVPKPCTVRRFCGLINQQTFHGLANENFRLIEQRSRQDWRVIGPGEDVHEIIEAPCSHERRLVFKEATQGQLERMMQVCPPPSQAMQDRQLVRIYAEGGIYRTFILHEELSCKKVISILATKFHRRNTNTEYVVYIVTDDSDVRPVGAEEKIVDVTATMLPGQYFLLKSKFSLAKGLSESLRCKLTNSLKGLGDYEVQSLLGKGTFGMVWRVKQISTGCIYALKVMKKVDIIRQNNKDHINLEREIMAKIGHKHPFIIGFHDAIQTPDRLFIIMECVDSGTLFNLLEQTEAKLPEPAVRFFAAQIFLALDMLHRQGFVYRDLKLENILIDARGCIRLSDFGLSHHCGPSERIQSFSGTPMYLAPEMLTDDGMHDFKVDWWAYGVLIFILLTFEPPFYSLDFQEMFEMIKEDEPNWGAHDFSPEALDLLQGLLCKDPAKRLACGSEGPAELQRHAFFSSIDWPKMVENQLISPLKPPAKERVRAVDQGDFETSFGKLQENSPQVKRAQDPELFKGFDFVNEQIVRPYRC